MGEITLDYRATFKQRCRGVLTGNLSRLQKLYKLSSVIASSLIENKKIGCNSQDSLNKYKFLARNILATLFTKKIDNVMFILECCGLSFKRAKTKFVAQAIRISLREIATHGLPEGEQTCVLLNKDNNFFVQITIRQKQNVADNNVVEVIIKIENGQDEINLDQTRANLARKQLISPLQ